MTSLQKSNSAFAAILKAVGGTRSECQSTRPKQSRPLQSYPYKIRGDFVIGEFVGVDWFLRDATC